MERERPPDPCEWCGSDALAPCPGCELLTCPYCDCRGCGT